MNITTKNLTKTNVNHSDLITTIGCLSSLPVGYSYQIPEGKLVRVDEATFRIESVILSEDKDDSNPLFNGV